MPLVAYAARLRQPQHPLATSGFFTRWLFFLDLMHLSDCKGVAAVVYGGVFAFLMSKADLGNNRVIRLINVNACMKSWYEDRPGTYRLPRIKMGNLRLDGWYELHGPAIKAANSRHAAPLFAYLARRFCVTQSESDTAVRALTALFEEFYAIIYSEPIFMSQQAIDRISEVCIELGHHFMILREHCRRLNILAWNLKPKVHKLQHIPMMCEIMNPRFAQCYSEESLIGTTTKVWKQSMAGRYERVVQRNVLAKRLLGLLLRYEP